MSTIKISVGGALPPKDYHYWFKGCEDNWLNRLEDVLLNHVEDCVIISVGRDSCKSVFQILKQHRLQNCKIGVHSKAARKDVQAIVDTIKKNGWEEYVDEDKGYNGRYMWWP